jgi:hypothetical protein
MPPIALAMSATEVSAPIVPFDSPELLADRNHREAEQQKIHRIEHPPELRGKQRPPRPAIDGKDGHEARSLDESNLRKSAPICG